MRFSNKYCSNFLYDEKSFFKTLVFKKYCNLTGQNHFWAFTCTTNHIYLKKLNRSVAYKHV